jgi:hypothetical protein
MGRRIPRPPIRSHRFQLVGAFTSLILVLAAVLGWLAYSAARDIVVRDAKETIDLAANGRKQTLLAVLKILRDEASFALEEALLACSSGNQEQAPCLHEWLDHYVSTEGATAGQLVVHGTEPITAGAGTTPLMETFLYAPPPEGEVARFAFDDSQRPYYVVWARSSDGNAAIVTRFAPKRLNDFFLDRAGLGEIGRASCRERV